MPKSTFRALLLLIALVPAVALAQVGRVLIAVGDVTALRAGRVVPLPTGSSVQFGDTLRVGANSNAQVRFTDESIVALRAGTEFRIDEYEFSGRPDGRDHSIFSLLKGGLRTVTGAIGRLQRRDAYAVHTPTATIGIRGTHYTLVHCNNDCGSNAKAGLELAAASTTLDDAGPLAQLGAGGPGVANGTYGGVTDGRIGVTNGAGDKEFGHDEYFYVADRQSPPQSLLAPPPFLHDRLSGQNRNVGQKGRESGDNLAQGGINAESRPSDVPPAPRPSDFVVTETRTQSGDLALVGEFDTGIFGWWVSPGSQNAEGGAALVSKTTALTFDATGKLTAFDVPANCIGPNNDCTDGASGTLTSQSQSGSATFPNSTQKVFWGAWNGGTINDAGQTIVLSSANQAHFMYAPLTPDTVIAGKTGTMVMNSFSLGTSPTNNLGETGSGAYPGITIDFTARTATFSSSTYTFPSQSWTFSGATGAITVVPGAGAYFRGDFTGTCGGSGGCGAAAPAPATGKAAGIFIGPAGDHAGVMLSGGTAGGGAFGTVRVYCASGC